MVTAAAANTAAGNNAFAGASDPIIGPGGTRTFSLVFRAAFGGPAGGFGNLD